MGANITAEQVMRLRHAEPFQPFTILLRDGRRFLVKEPDFVARSGAGRTIAVATEDDAHSIVDISNVAALEVIPSGIDA